MPQTGNLIANGDFSILEDGQPKGWETGMWVTSAGASYLEAVTLADRHNRRAGGKCREQRRAL